MFYSLSYEGHEKKRNDRNDKNASNLVSLDFVGEKKGKSLKIFYLKNQCVFCQVV